MNEHSDRPRPTQAERVLAALRRRGPAGITQVDLLRPHVIDGGSPIWRLPARVSELRARGHEIEASTVRTSGGARIASYRLIEPSSAAEPQAGAVGEPLSLDVGDEPARRPLSPYDPRAEA